MNQDKTIDLHGLTKDQAIEVLESTLSDCFIRKIRKLTVIHGKGKGIVKTAVTDYLNGLDYNIDIQYTAENTGQLIIWFRQ